MLDWIATVLVLSVGFLVMVTGLIEYLFIGFMIYLLSLVVLSLVGKVWMYFHKKNETTKKNMI
ncbi:TPA: hypothetical protein QHR34_004066 [Raoultella ornithinolytica]|nr:hypothetical protein [Raoultella ornithinolytica]